MNPRYEIEGSSIVKWTPTVVKNGEQWLTNFARSKPITHPNVLPGVDIKLYPSGLGAVVKLPLPTLSIRTHFAPIVDEAGGPWMVPVWQDNGRSISTCMELREEDLPEGCTMWFFYKVGGNGTSCAVAIHDAVGHDLRLPPIGNLYLTGLICMGSSWTNNQPTGSLIERAQKSLDHFRSSENNADLAAQARADRAILKFHPETKRAARIPREKLGQLALLDNELFEGFFPESEVRI